ncbi:MAG TPA: GTPase [Natronosporangium sp.]|nr:GTPase [Natronosporangium sp.]
MTELSDRRVPIVEWRDASGDPVPGATSPLPRPRAPEPAAPGAAEPERPPASSSLVSGQPVSAPPVGGAASGLTVPARAAPPLPFSAPPGFATAWLDAGALGNRIDALGRFRRAVSPYLPPDRLRATRAVADHARQRLSVAPELTVVALAGPTGSGKSSLFNALAGRIISPVGVRRPTTSTAHACVWGPLSEAAPLLDWLDVDRQSRYRWERPLGGDDQPDLSGLVLLDLPDFDSVEREHTNEVERLLDLVDVVVWVVDPQKYADRLIHEQYLRRFTRHQDVTLLALNQADLLSAGDVTQLLADLRRLLAADGVKMTAIATSAVDLPAGVEQLRAHLAELVGSRRAAWQRLAADVDRVVDDLADLVGPPADPQTADRAAFGELADGLADAAGVPALAERAERAHQQRAQAVLGSPVVRWWLRRRRPEPSQPDRDPGAVDPQEVASGLAVRVAVRLAVRSVATRAAEGLPPPWPEAIWRASRSRLAELPAALAAVLADRSEPDLDATPRWWRLIGGYQWLATVAAVTGLGWLVLGPLLGLFAPIVRPGWAAVLLFGAGTVAGAVGAVLTRPLVRWAGRQARVRARKELRDAVAEVGREYAVAPVREVLAAYAEAREALHTAAGL